MKGRADLRRPAPQIPGSIACAPPRPSRPCAPPILHAAIDRMIKGPWSAATCGTNSSSCPAPHPAAGKKLTLTGPAPIQRPKTMDIKTYMQTVGRQAQRRQPLARRPHTDARTRPSSHRRRRIRARKAQLSTPTLRISPKPAPMASGGDGRPPHPVEKGIEAMAVGLEQSRRPARSGRRR